MREEKMGEEQSDAPEEARGRDSMPASQQEYEPREPEQGCDRQEHWGKLI